MLILDEATCPCGADLLLSSGSIPLEHHGSLSARAASVGRRIVTPGLGGYTCPTCESRLRIVGYGPDYKVLAVKLDAN